MPAARAEYCTSSPGLLKWFGIIIGSVVLALLLVDYNDPAVLHPAEQYVVFVAAFTIAICLLLLLVFFFDMHRGVFHGCRCHVLVSWIMLLLCLLWLAAAGAETWYTVVNNHRGSRFVGMRAAVAALSFLAAFLFGAAMQQTRVVVLYTDI
jgi:hypothetical protein